MKKTNTIIFTLLLLVATFAFVAAQDQGAEKIPQVGRFAALRLAFTFNPEKKIERALDIAEARYARAEEENNSEKAAKFQEQYEKFTAKAESALEKFEAKADNNKSSEDYITKMARVENRLEEHQERIDTVYLRVLERLNASNASEEAIARIEEIHEKQSQKNDDRLEKFKEKQQVALKIHKRLNGMSEEELNATLMRIETAQGVREARAKRAERAKKRAQEVLRMRLNNSNLTEDEQAVLRAKIEKQFRIANRIRLVAHNSSEFGEMAREKIANSNMTDVEKEAALERLEKLENSTGEAMYKTPVVTNKQLNVAKKVVESELAQRVNETNLTAISNFA